MWQLHRVVPWKAVVTLNSTSLLPRFKLNFPSCSDVNRILLRNFFSGFSTFSSDASVEQLASSTSNFSSFSSDNSGSLVTSLAACCWLLLPNQPNQELDLWLVSDLSVSKEFSKLFSLTGWQVLVSSDKTSAGRGCLKSTPLKCKLYSISFIQDVSSKYLYG